MYTQQEISDRLEIQDLLNRYSYAIDERNFDDLDNVFTPDATIDYSQVGGDKGLEIVILVAGSAAAPRQPGADAAGAGHAAGRAAHRGRVDG